MGAFGVHTWSDLPRQLEVVVPKLNSTLSSDSRYQAFVNTAAITTPFTFGIKATGSDYAVLVTVDNGKELTSSGSSHKALL
jgi:hypothetical protein